MESATFWQEVSNEAHLDRRRQKRVPLAFPINVCGIDETGHFFSENTSTWDITEKGCRFHTSRKVEVGDVVAINLATRSESGREDNRPLLFEVRWIQAEKNGWLVGTVCPQSRNLWKLAFPPAN